MSRIKVYSTGPLENQANNRSRTVFTKLLNISRNRTARARVLVFQLNGRKTLISRSGIITIAPGSSEFVRTDLNADVEQFEVRIRVIGSLLLGVFGKTARGNLNPSHRLVHREITRIARKRR